MAVQVRLLASHRIYQDGTIPLDRGVDAAWTLQAAAKRSEAQRSAALQAAAASCRQRPGDVCLASRQLMGRSAEWYAPSHGSSQKVCVSGTKSFKGVLGASMLAWGRVPLFLAMNLFTACRLQLAGCRLQIISTLSG